MVKKQKSAMETLRDAAISTDLPDLIRQQHQAAQLLRRIAEREEFDSPAVAIRASAAAARVFSDTVGAVVVQERLDKIGEEIEAIKAERRNDQGHSRRRPPGSVIGISPSGHEVRTPTWGGGVGQKTDE